MEALLPVDPGGSVYGYGSDYEPDSGQGVLNGGCVGLHHQYGAGQVLCLSFPLYNMQEAASQTLVEHVFGELFAENTAAASISVTAVPGIRLSSAHPNPFRAQTGFRVETDDTISPLSVDIYNLRGQKLANLFTGRPPSNAEFVWDGRDAAGKPAGSGIYIIRAASARHTAQLKILKLN